MADGDGVGVTEGVAVGEGVGDGVGEGVGGVTKLATRARSEDGVNV